MFEPQAMENRNATPVTEQASAASVTEPEEFSPTMKTRLDTKTRIHVEGCGDCFK